MKRIVLCADDYGQASTISKAIIALIQHGRISATSCIVNYPDWLTQASWLSPFQNKIDIGLHFNLTEGKPLSSAYIAKYGDSFFPLSRLLTKAFFRRLDRLAIEEELSAQIAAFVKAFDCLPNYIDGHQHVHQFPIIQQALINVYQNQFKGNEVYIRLAQQKIRYVDFRAILKNLIISVSGSKGLKKLLDQYHIPYNSSFAGIYSFVNTENYKQFFTGFLRQVDDKGLIMCHPGLEAQNGDDEIAKARYIEYQYLMSQQFLIDCEKEGVSLGRFQSF